MVQESSSIPKTFWGSKRPKPVILIIPLLQQCYLPFPLLFVNKSFPDVITTEWAQKQICRCLLLSKIIKEISKNVKQCHYSNFCLFWKTLFIKMLLLLNNRLISIFKWINQFFKFSVLICIMVHTDIPHIGIFNDFQEYKVSLQLKSLLA